MPSAAKPLGEQTLLLLRAVGQEAELMAALRQLGASVLHIPVLEIQPPASYDALDAALHRLNGYQWLLFTSPNGVSRFSMRAAELGIVINAGALGQIQVCAIGPATRAEAEAHGIHVHLLPEEHVAEGLVASFAGVDLRGMRVLLPRAAAGRDVAPEALRALGASVDVVEAYRTGMPTAAEARIQSLLESGQRVDWVLFSSGSTVKNFLAAGGRPLLNRAKALSIGPATTEVMRRHGLDPALECEHHSGEGLVKALSGAGGMAGSHASMEDSAGAAQ
ncbi:MAG: uroporphyrinogen-III synthase [Bryobacterales bacterium]|nr:uroporphyrinogen-III synthase [Bryobacterales bacterium]